MPTEEELRIECFCRFHPLLAMCGRDDHGDLYVHIKSQKGDRINAEALVTSGVVRIRCRDCLRWHTVRINKHGYHAKPERLPESIHL